MHDERQDSTRRGRPVPDRRADWGRMDEARHPGRAPGAIPPHMWAVGVLLLLMLITICGLSAVLLLGDGWPGHATATPTVATRTAAASPSPTPTEIPEPTPTMSPDIFVGARVRVAGTGGEGLSLRAGPGTAYTRMRIALDGEAFIIADGPTRAGGATWWKLRDPSDPELSYWALGNYLELAAQP